MPRFNHRRLFRERQLPRKEGTVRAASVAPVAFRFLLARMLGNEPRPAGQLPLEHDPDSWLCHGSPLSMYSVLRGNLMATNLVPRDPNRFHLAIGRGREDQ